MDGKTGSWRALNDTLDSNIYFTNLVICPRKLKIPAKFSLDMAATSMKIDLRSEKHASFCQLLSNFHQTKTVISWSSIPWLQC